MQGHEDVAGFVSGGYKVGRLIPRPEFLSKELVPEQIITMSDCLTEFVPGIWALRWVARSNEERLEQASHFGIPPDNVDRVIGRMTTAFDAEEFLWPDVFPTVQLARAFCKDSLAGQRDLMVLGIGLREELADELLDRGRPSSGQNPPGVYRCVGKRQPPENGGKVLGFEVLGYGTPGQFHSWYCHSMEVDIFCSLLISPGLYGLIQSYPEAEAVAEHCRKANAPVEPGVWLPWLVVQYYL